MGRVRFNIAANIVGQGWGLFLSLLCTPFYIKLLGVEAYGLVAFFFVLQSVVQLFDFGLGTTMSREIARLAGSVRAEDRSMLARLAVTFEKWYWFLGLVLGVALFFAIPSFVYWWVNPQLLGRPEVVDAARAFAVLVLLQWPATYYQNGLAGLQRQVELNAIQIPFAGLASVGGLLFIWLGPRSIAALVGWQAATMFCQIVVLHYRFWARAAVERKGVRADADMLLRQWRFSLGMSGISTTGLVLTHLDKLILSRLLALESFGHYSIAGAIARGLYVVITPVFSAYFPKLSALVAQGDGAQVRASYHTATQVMAVLILPLAALVGFFAEEIAALWLHNQSLAREVAPIAGILVVGTCLNGLMNIPFALQLAHGRTGIGLAINLGLMAILVPSIVFATTKFGALGGAAMWAIANAMYLAIGLPVTQKLLLGGEIGQWLLKDILPPLAATLAVVATSSWLVPSGLHPAASLAALVTTWILATVFAALSSDRVREAGRLQWRALSSG